MNRSEVMESLTFDEARELALKLINAGYVAGLKKEDKVWIVVTKAKRTKAQANSSKVST